jgi:hypothetical protein
MMVKLAKFCTPAARQIRKFPIADPRGMSIRVIGSAVSNLVISASSRPPSASDDMIFMTVEFRDSANAPLALPEEIRRAAA